MSTGEDMIEGAEPASPREEAIRRFAETRHAGASDWSVPGEASRRALAGVEDLWRGLDHVADDPVVSAMRAQARDRLAKRAVKISPGRQGWWSAGGLTVAAAAIGAVVLSAVPLHTDRAPTESYRVVANGRRPPRTVVLVDGSKLTLDAQSSVRLASSGGGRRVLLDRGQAFFEVRHDPNHTFQVVAGAVIVTDIGTGFNVRLASSGVAVAVVEGSVGIAMPVARGGRLQVVLERGDSLTTTGGVSHIRHDANVQGTGWRTGVLSFDNRPLDQVLAELNRYLETPLVLRDVSAGKVKVSGLFRVDDPQGLIEALDAMDRHGLVSPRPTTG